MQRRGCRLTLSRLVQHKHWLSHRTISVLLPQRSSSPASFRRVHSLSAATATTTSRNTLYYYYDDAQLAPFRCRSHSLTANESSSVTTDGNHNSSCGLLKRNETNDHQEQQTLRLSISPHTSSTPQNLEWTSQSLPSPKGDTTASPMLGQGNMVEMDDQLWWETAQGLLKSRDLDLFLQKDNNNNKHDNSLLTRLEHTFNTLQRLCLLRPGTRQTSELVHSFLEMVRQLLQTHHHNIGRTHFHTSQSSQNKRNDNRSKLLASLVHQTMAQIVCHPHNLWKPNSTIAFQILMRLAQLEQNPPAAQSWLDWQWRASRNQSSRSKQHHGVVQAPNRHDYTAVVEAWSHSSLPEAPERCALLVRQLQQRYAQGKEPTMQPTEAAYVGWIVALTTPNRSNHKNKSDSNHNPRVAAMAAQQVLQEMWDRVELDHFIPSTTIYNVVATAWARAGDPPQAEAVLREQCEKALQHDYCRPDATSFAAVLSAYARSEDETAPERAEALLALQCRYASQMSTAQERARVQPNVVTYTIILDSWAKSNRYDAPLRAHAILQQMNEHAASNDDESNNGVAPNTLSYNAVLNAWARSGRLEAVERVEELWQEMQARQIPADAVTYMTRINVWERHRGPDVLPRTAARRAARVLHEMIEQSNIPPTTLHFNRVILAWTQCGDALRAEALLEVMISYWLRGGGNSTTATNTAAVPNLSSFNFVLSGWSKQSSRAAAAQAEALLDRMEEYSSTLLGGNGDDCSKAGGDGSATLRLPVRPDVVSFNTVIASWARAGEDCEVAWERAVALKRRMESTPHRLQPDIYTYGSLLQIVSRNQHMASGERATNANQLLLEMQDSGVEPNGFILRLVDQCTAVRRGDSG